MVRPARQPQEGPAGDIHFKMIKVKRIDHVAIALPALAPGLATFQNLFSLQTGSRESVSAQKTNVCFLHTGSPDDDATAIELISPAGNESLQRFVDKRGQAMHHICLEVEDLALALQELASAGVELIDKTPRPGARGHLVAFIHPRSTGGVLFELCQTSHAETAK